ncbi:hypothetical protein T12_9459 [Trichinella patagoniensis]|uniref:Uncharacterized protein n=1 Tax=Trichinella patagoniensis TaxID=990121 RepID=A0A0V0ZT07_9BILA|nr:hypothetical protein T12_9459 [Trichinella patagoniensis]
MFKWRTTIKIEQEEEARQETRPLDWNKLCFIFVLDWLAFCSSCNDFHPSQSVSNALLKIGSFICRRKKTPKPACCESPQTAFGYVNV